MEKNEWFDQTDGSAEDEVFLLDDLLEEETPTETYRPVESYEMPEHPPVYPGEYPAYPAESYPSYQEEEPDSEADRRSGLRVLAGAFDFVGILVGIICIFALVALIVLLINWLSKDIRQSAVFLSGSFQ